MLADIFKNKNNYIKELIEKKNVLGLVESINNKYDIKLDMEKVSSIIDKDISTNLQRRIEYISEHSNLPDQQNIAEGLLNVLFASSNVSNDANAKNTGKRKKRNKGKYGDREL